MPDASNSSGTDDFEPGPTSASRTERSPRSPARWRRLPRSIRILLVVAILALVGCVVVYILGLVATAEWDEYADSLRREGQPLTYAEIFRSQRGSPEGPTAASRIVELNEELDRVSASHIAGYVWVFDQGAGMRDAFAGVPQYSLEPTREFLGLYQNLVKHLVGLSDLPAGRLPRPKALDPNEVYVPSNVEGVRTAIKLLRVYATMALVDGDGDGDGNGDADGDADGDAARAVTATRAMYKITDTLDESPSLLERFVQIDLEAFAVHAVEDILCATTLDEQQIEALSQIVDARLSAPTMKAPLVGERAAWIALCDSLATGSQDLSWFLTVDPFSEGLKPRHRRVPLWLTRKNQLRGAEMLGRLIYVADKPGRLLDAARDVRLERASSNWMYFLVRTYMTGIYRTCDLHAKSIAWLRSARVALAAERFRMATGGLPTSLDELVPQYLDAEPADPFAGAPIRLVTTDRGIVIYSIGEDEHDDGGDVAPAPKDRRPPSDTGFRLLEPEHRGITILDIEPPSDH